MAESRLDRLEATVREMRKRLEPQAMKDALEKTWDPRGYADWTRVTGSSGGQASPPRRLLQFPGATITDDPSVGDRGATVVTISGGGGGAAYRFSDTYPSTAADERIEFVAESGPAVDHMIVDTGSIGTLRVGQMVVAEDVSSPDPSGSVQFLADSATGQTNATLGVISGPSTAAAGAISDGTTGDANISAINGLHNAIIGVTSDGGLSATSAMMTVTEDGVALTYMRVEPGTILANASGAYGVDVVNDSGESSFVQNKNSGSSALPTTLKRYVYGPYVDSPRTLAVGGQVTFTIPDCRSGTNYSVEGGVKGVAGSAWIGWSFDDSGVNDVSITLTNMDPSTFHTVTFYCTVVCDA